MNLIHRHFLKSAVGPFFFGLFVSTFVLMIDILYRYVDLFISKGVPFLQATEVLALSLGHTFALSVPMAVLIAVLMSVGQLAADQEITALKANGVSLFSVLRPLLAGAGIIALLMTAYNHFVFPNSNHRLANLLFDINRKSPMMEIREQMFTDMNDRMTIFVRKKDDHTGRIEDVTIFEKAEPGDPSPRLTTAEWGRILPEPERDAMRIELHDGEIHEIPDKDAPDKYQLIRFSRHVIHLKNMERDYENSNRTSRGDREMDLKALLAAAKVERGNQDQALQHTDGLVHDLLAWEWELLDPVARLRPTGRAGGSREELTQAFRRAKHIAARQKVELTAKQAEYQEKIRQNYHARENRYMVEFHKKFAIPVACLVFVLLGVPMAVTTARSGRGVSVSLALAVYLVYYLCLVGGERFADRGKMDPWVAMWTANILLTAVGIPIFLRTVRESALLASLLRPPTPAGRQAER